MKYLANIILFLIYVELMILVVEIIFWSSLFIVFYTYAGYPLLLMLLTRLKKKPSGSTTYNFPGDDYPSVTIVIAAYNEEKVLEAKILNTLDLEYPADKYHILIITDGSTDRSNEIADRYPAVKLLFEPLRAGKLAAINRAMDTVKTDIVIFCDANTILNKDSITNLIRHFKDPVVGGVAGEKKVAGADGLAGGEGAYWRYESFLKKLDSKLYSVVGAAGELFAMRTSLYQPLDNMIIEDFVQSMLICRKGYVVRYEPAAFAVEKASVSLTDERERKTRISAGGFQAMGVLAGLLNIFRYGWLSFQYISHRVLRWTLTPLALIAMVRCSLYLYHYADLYAWFFWLQAVAYAAALLGAITRLNIFQMPFYFFFMNFCVVAGFLRYLRGSQPTTWRKASR